MQMTKAQLGDFVKDVLKDVGGPQIVELVEAQMAKALAAHQAEPAWMAKLMDGIARGGKTEPAARDKGLGLARIARAMACAKLDGTGFDGGLKVLSAWGDKDLADQMTDAKTKALAAGSGPSGGYLVPIQQSQEIIELRRAATVVRGSGVPEMPLMSGTMQVPKIATGATGTYIGENQNITKSEQTFGNVQLTAHKLAVITPVSNDLVRNSSPQADTIVRNDLVRSLALTEDQAFLRGDGNNAAPKGLRNLALAANQISAAASASSLTNITADIGLAILALMNNNTAPGRWTWIMAPRSWKALMIVQTTTGAFAYREEMSNGTLFGFPYKVTTSIPITLTPGGLTDGSEVYLFNADDQIIGDSLSLSIDVSTEAAYYDGSTTVAAFSRDQTVIRAITEHDFQTRYPESIAVLVGTRWA